MQLRFLESCVAFCAEVIRHVRSSTADPSMWSRFSSQSPSLAPVKTPQLMFRGVQQSYVNYMCALGWWLSTLFTVRSNT